MRKLDARQLAREKNLFRYSSALERADFTTVAAILQEAERDPLLAQMIAEINTVYESETFRLSPSLNHSSNHRQPKDLLMTTLVLPNRQRNMQRWLPITLAAACVSVLFIGALMLHPIHPNNIQAGIQAQSSATPSPAASATIIPSPTAPNALLAVTMPPTVVAPDVQFSASAVGTPVCGGTKVITQDTFVRARPSNKSTILGGVKAGTQAEVLVTGNPAEDDTSTPKTEWFFIKADVDGNSVQGWVGTNSTQPLDPTNACPTNEVAVASEALPATVIAGNAQPIFSVAGTSICSAITLEGTTAHVTNQNDKPATLFAAPLTINSNASVVGELPMKSDAVLLYQQYDQQSDPLGALWYLIMTNGTGDKQITGWVSANSVTSEKGCSSDAAVSSGTTAAVTWTQLEPITGVAMTGSTQIGTCHIINLSPAPATLFAAPLTSDSNAPAVGTLSANGNAVVIFQNYDVQSSPIGAVWYLVTTSSDQQVTGWVSATSINSSNTCAPEQLTGVTLSNAALSQDPLHIVAVASAGEAVQNGRCVVTNPTDKAAPLFAAPLTKDSNAAVVGEFPANSDAVVILQNYDQQSDPIGALWYLITTNGDKRVTGWISANSINSSDGCAAQATGAGTVPAVASQVQSAGVTAATASSDTAPAGVCHVVNQQTESLPVYSGPSSKSDESVLVNNLTPNVPATVLYQQRDTSTGDTWYLILAVEAQGKQISGWVSADSVQMVDRCPALP